MPTDAQKLASSVARLNRRLRQERRSDLSPTQLAVLGTINKCGPLTNGAIAAREGVQPPSVTRTVNGLVDEGLALREPHPSDGRQVVVSVSDKGQAVLEEERGRRDTWLAHRLAELEPAERELLRRAAALLERLGTA